MSFPDPQAVHQAKRIPRSKGAVVEGKTLETAPQATLNLEVAGSEPAPCNNKAHSLGKTQGLAALVQKQLLYCREQCLGSSQAQVVLHFGVLLAFQLPLQPRLRQIWEE